MRLDYILSRAGIWISNLETRVAMTFSISRALFACFQSSFISTSPLPLSWPSSLRMKPSHCVPFHLCLRCGRASFLISLGILIRRSLSQVVKTCYTSPSWRDDDETDSPCGVAYSAFGEKSRRRLAVLWRRALLSYFFAMSLLFSFTFFLFFFFAV